MSGILMPFVKFANAINNQELVPVDNTNSADPVDVPALNNVPAEYQIIFTPHDPVGGVTKAHKIRFAAKTDRDNALAAFQAATTATL